MTAALTASPRTAPAAVPFVGLRPFDLGDQRWFFGRARETAALADNIRSHRFTVVIGASGSGKSSLVRAGVLPILAGEGWRSVVTTPGAAPIERLAKVLAAAVGEDDGLLQARRSRFDASLRASCHGLAEVAAIFPPENELRLLVVDQFEELFRYGEEARGGTAEAMREEARAFVELLLTAASVPGRLSIVITMRSDFFGNCAAYRGLAEAVSRSQYLVPAPGRDQLEEAIRRPIDAAGATIDSMLVQRLLIDVEEEIDKLPLLQHTLRRLWERADGASRHLGESQYRAVGGLAGSIDVQASWIAEQLESDAEHPEDALTLKLLMQALTDFDSHGRATRRPQRRSALVELLTDGNKARRDVVNASLDRVMAPLSAEDTSFLRIGAEEFDPVVDIGHEALVRSWRRLSGDDRDFAIGWLREEAHDGLTYRYLRQLALTSSGETPSGPPIAWWGRRNPTRQWAERYGGDFDRVSEAVYQAAPELKPLRAQAQSALDVGAYVGLVGTAVATATATDKLTTVYGGARAFATIEWWKRGIDCARAVALIRQRLGGPRASGFLLRASDLGLGHTDELLVLTCFHAVNETGLGHGLRPSETEVVFETVDGTQIYAVKEIVWSSPVLRHDASLLRLERPVTGIQPLAIARALPLLDLNERVYVIGHPGGRELTISMADNELLDHEGPPEGRPEPPDVVRVHYRAPTEPGSAGSPVFNSLAWQVIAMHHARGDRGIPRLNGKGGTYGASEGIGVQSIAEAIKGSHASSAVAGLGETDATSSLSSRAVSPKRQVSRANNEELLLGGITGTSGSAANAVLQVARVPAAPAEPRAKMATTTRRGFSLHIGLNSVSAAHYGGWTGSLAACEFDAKDMAALATGRGMKATVLLSKDGTRAKVLAALRAATKTLVKGDFFLLTYSGNGGQVPDVSGEEADKLDETWCLYDGQLIDDELYLELGKFATGVRILVLSDSGHSGTVVRAGPHAIGSVAPELRSKMMPPSVAMRTYEAHKDFYDKLQRDVAAANAGALANPDEALANVAVTTRLTKIAKRFKARAILIFGCQDNQSSYDGAHNGAFTGRLLKVWNRGNFDGNYATFYEQIRAGMPSNQTPKQITLGRVSKFAAERPLTI